MISFRSDSLEKGLTIGALRASAAPRERLHRSANRGQAEGLISDRSRVGLLCKKSDGLSLVTALPRQEICGKNSPGHSVEVGSHQISGG